MKKIISLLICAVIAMSPAVSVMAEETENDSKVIFENEIFKTQAFTLYDDTDTGGITQVWTNYGLAATINNGWNADTNGIKADITAYVKGLSGKNFRFSADVMTYSWKGSDGYNNKAKAFFEVIDGSDNKTVTTICTGPDETVADGGTVTLSGTAELTFDENDKVYLCVTQGGGYEQISNLNLSYLEPNELFGNDIFQEGKFSIYDDTNTAGSITAVWAGYGVQADMGNDWGNNNGVKTDITEYVANYSGCSFSVSADITSWAWLGTDDYVNKADVFFEVVRSGEEPSIINITSGPELADKITEDSESGGKKATVSGSAELSFNEGDKVYLCFKQGGGTQQYRNISFSVLEPVKVIDNKIFQEGFKLYDDTNDEGSITVYDNDGINVFMGDNHSFDANNGVKLNITNYVSGLSGQTFDLSVDAVSYAWEGDDNGTPVINKAKAFFKVLHKETADGEETQEVTSTDIPIYEGPETAVNNGVTVTLKGTAALDFAEGDTVYLCFTQGGQSQQYKNLSLSVQNTASDSALTVGTPSLKADTEGKAEVTASNTTDSDAELIIYVATYSETVLTEVSKTTVTVQAGETDKVCDFDASAGDVVYIWDSGMKPYAPKTELSAEPAE